MTETPSGSRWEPAGEDTAPLSPTPPAPPASPSDAAAATPPPAPGDPVVPVSEYGWAPARGAGGPEPARTGRRRTGALAAGVAALVLGIGAGGYAIGSATAGADGQDLPTARLAPDDGDGPGLGLPGQSDRDGDDDHGGDHDGDDDGFFGSDDGTDDGTDDGAG